ncbi:hypothetical protein [Winogradskyella arenosi]|uniref:Membrane protein YeaQ/YmgE (Transglycosylase-associated protein family) n=1 Tax=Winogradskyella arenosi TaxID=533325 RepID=A0A368ZGD9_9FLAO|nr:hypothetical protein [Winogradskyella arenosi]RCW92503.1 hypothetical protein DFQ08_102532 [Winogradskyella arenosi]
MTGTLISLISIFIGLIAANVFAYFNKKYSFGFTGNTLIGVFGSILFIKTFGRLGFDPWSIMDHGNFNTARLIVNFVVSALGGVLLMILAKKLYLRINKS